VVCPVPQGAENSRESVNPAKMKLCPDFHNPFASKRTTVALHQYVFWCQEEVNSPTSAKASRLRSYAHCGVQSFKSCAETFHDGAEKLQGRRPAAYDGEESFWCIFPAKERGSKQVHKKNMKQQ